MSKNRHPLGFSLLVLLLLSCSKQGPAQQPASAVATPAPTPVAETLVAKLSEFTNDVKIKRSRELAWNKVEKQEDLVTRDAVKTGATSTGTIAYNDDTQLKMTEKTMVIIIDKKSDSNGEQSTLALPRGTLGGKLERKSGKTVELIVRTSSGWIRASNARKAEFTAKVSEKGRLEVQNYGAPVEVMAENKTQILKPQEQITIPESGKELPEEPEAALAAMEAPPAIPEKTWEKAVKTIEPAQPTPSPTPAATSIATAAAPVLPREDKVEILHPNKKMSVLETSLDLQIKILGKMKVFLNGKALKPGSSGLHESRTPLNPGINLLTFQIVGPTPDKVRYETFEITRK